MDEHVWTLFQETGAPEFYLMSREEAQPNKDSDKT